MGRWGGKALQVKCLLENSGEGMTSNFSKVNTDGGGMGRGRKTGGVGWRSRQTSNSIF